MDLNWIPKSFKEYISIKLLKLKKYRWRFINCHQNLPLDGKWMKGRWKNEDPAITLENQILLSFTPHLIDIETHFTLTS